ncbi:conserved hypothetical protein [Actinacidiphila bryophytorum]|uniref:Uncharacterized protein n=1 Tax=Actinacidiphila bryophytorum TaxID=1436133 RepID=A0A9W4H2R0_9ACTN|nr:conserved hypothetical protein [Actinacidiphila bryophytorum]
MERDRLVRRRQRLLGVQHRAERCRLLRHRLRQAGRGRRLRGRQPVHRCRGLRQHGLPGLRRLDGLRRYERVLARHRLGVRPRGEHRLDRQQLPLHPRLVAVGRHLRQQRQLPDHSVVQRPHRLGRPDRAGHPERHRGLLTPS